MKLKRITAIMLVTMLAFGSMTTIAASTFKDVADDYWAKEYIEEMYSIGLIKGYPDGTFGPANAVSKWESLILAARVLGFNDPENDEYIELASDKYMSKLASYDVKNKEELCYLLYWGVIEEDDLAGYLAEDKKNAPELRYEAAILLTKVMGGEEEALNQSSVVIEYDDASDIPTAAKPYVSYVTGIKVMQGTGNNKFDPRMQVSRAQMSTMMYNTMRAMNLEQHTVTVQSVVASQSEISAYDVKGASQKYIADAGTIYRADGNAASIKDIKSGMVLRISKQNDDIRLIEWNSEATQMVAEGKVVSASTAYGGELTIGVVDEDGFITNETFKVVATAAIIYDGDSISLSQVKPIYYATVYYSGNNNAYKVELAGKASTANGTFVGYSLDPNTITINNDNGSKETYLMLDGVGVTRNDRDASIYDIAKGDRLVLVLEYRQVKTIKATSIDQTVEGTIKELVFGDTNYITVKLANSSLEKYNISDDTNITIDDVVASMYDLRPGAQIKLVAASTNATKISSYATVAPSHIIGKVKAVNATYNLVTLENIADGLDQQVLIKGTCTFVDNTGSGINSLKKLQPGYQVTVFGNISNGAYLVNTLIVTK
ncbi:MAG: S-layer homology domain-containing protein [Eubacteriales bacterium]|nr:S-layer homology domain-containing protein [Eubacteriales bacterium]